MDSMYVEELDNDRNKIVACSLIILTVLTVSDQSYEGAHSHVEAPWRNT
jgi:hypothetical protein